MSKKKKKKKKDDRIKIVHIGIRNDGKGVRSLSLLSDEGVPFGTHPFTSLAGYANPSEMIAVAAMILSHVKIFTGMSDDEINQELHQTLMETTQSMQFNMSMGGKSIPEPEGDHGDSPDP